MEKSLVVLSSRKTKVGEKSLVIEKLSMIVVFAAIFWQIQLTGQYAALSILFFLCFCAELIFCKVMSGIYAGQKKDLNGEAEENAEATKNGPKLFAIVLFIALAYNLFLALVS